MTSEPMARRHFSGHAGGPASATRVRNTRSRQSGYAFLVALFMMLIVAAGTIVLLENLVTDGRRIREQQTVWRGEQYKRGIRLYYRKTGHFPQNVDDLIKGVPGVHFLREKYKDPMNSADGSWRFIYVNAAGQITGSVRYATLQQMVLVDQYLGLVPGAIPLGPQNAGIGVPASSLSSLGGTALSSQVAQAAQAVQGGQISQSQISSVLNSIPGLPPGITPAQAQQFMQNMPPDQLQSLLQNLPPDQQAAANEALQNLQSQPPPDQSGQSDQNPPDPNNPQNPQGPGNQQQYSPNSQNSQNPPNNNDNANDSQDTGGVIPLPAGSNGLTASGQAINPLLLMKPTGPVDSPVFGAFLIGVGIPPNVERKSVKLYRGGKKYNQWEFIWNPLEDTLSGSQNGSSSGSSAAGQGGILGGQLPGGTSGGSSTPSFGGGSTSPQPQQ
jgi:hypothetical protein